MLLSKPHAMHICLNNMHDQWQGSCLTKRIEFCKFVYDNDCLIHVHSNTIIMTRGTKVVATSCGAGRAAHDTVLKNSDPCQLTSL